MSADYKSRVEIALQNKIQSLANERQKLEQEEKQKRAHYEAFATTCQNIIRPTFFDLKKTLSAHNLNVEIKDDLRTDNGSPHINFNSIILSFVAPVDPNDTPFNSIPTASKITVRRNPDSGKIAFLSEIHTKSEVDTTYNKELKLEDVTQDNLMEFSVSVIERAMK